jgi:hypothetical protein
MQQAYAAGEISYADLWGQLPGRSWDAIASQGRLLGLGLRRPAVYYRLVVDTREIIDIEDPSIRAFRKQTKSAPSRRLPLVSVNQFT